MYSSFIVIWLLMVLSGFCISLLFYVYRALQLHNRPQEVNTPPLIYLVAMVFFLMLGIIGLVVDPAPLIIQLASPILLYAGILAGYFVNYWIVYNKYQPLKRARILYVVVAASFVTVILDLMRGKNTGSFPHNDQYQPSLIYYAYYILIDSFIIYLCILTIKLFIKSFNQSSNYSYLLRRFIGMLSYVFALLAAGSALISILLAAFIGNHYQGFFNNMLYAILPFVGIFSLIHIVPAKLIEYLIRPLERHRDHHNERNAQLIRSLHTMITTCVFSVQRVPNSYLSVQRMIIEINDARDILWTHIPHSNAISVGEEAAIIRQFYSSGTIVHAAGPYPLPPITANSFHRNVAVAKHLTSHASALPAVNEKI